MTLPRPGETRLRNLVATMILHGNGLHTVNIEVIAHHQKLDPVELRAEFTTQETAASLKPKNSCEVIDK